MNGIDTSAAALLANRIGALQPVAAQPSAGAMQTGVSALAGGAAAQPVLPATPAQQQASAQTVLSAVALALDAIVRSGGDATPAVMGTTPVWPNPNPDPQAVQQAVDDAAAGMLATLMDAMDVAGTDAAMLTNDVAPTPDGGADNATTGTNAAAQTAATAATVATGSVAALAASLQRTVSGSGLFYESHLEQWLLGQRSPAELAGEPQNRLVASPTAQLPLDWQHGVGEAEDVFWTDPQAPQAPHAPGTAPPTAGGTGAARAANPAQSTLFDDDWLNALPGQSADTAQTHAQTQTQTASQGQPLTVHAAVLPLLRQQLDMLATGEFRWTGEAWPGVRLDWSIRQDGDDPRRAHNAPDLDVMPWRTRLTLSLPSLGIVDAELTLVGATLGVRVQAGVAGAARLAANGDALRGRLAAAGIELNGLSIREVGGAAPGGADAARAADAYARAAAGSGGASSNAVPPASSGDTFDWEDPR
jgi:hypothetical protein